MDLEIKWSKLHKERQISHDVTYMQSLKKHDTDEFYKTETDSQT